VIHLGVHVGVKTVFLGSRLVPSCRRLLVGKANLDEALGALEPIFPRYDDAHRRAVLLRQHFAVHAKSEQRQRVHGFVQPQAFDVRPLQHARIHARHGDLVGQRHKFHVFRATERFHTLDQLDQRVTHPGNHHGPALDTAQAVNAVFLSGELEQFVQAELARLLDQALDAHAPRVRLERVGIARRVGFVGAKLIEVVVAGGIFIRSRLFHGDRTQHLGGHARQRRQFAWMLCRRQCAPPGPGGQGGAGSACRQAAQQHAPFFVHALRRNLGRNRVHKPVIAMKNGHKNSSWPEMRSISVA